MAFALTSSQKTTVSVQFQDKKGHPATAENIEWLTDSPALLALTPASDGLSCDVAAVGPLGTGLVTLKADGDLGDGETPIIGTLEVEVGAGNAAVVVLTPGTPVEQ